MALNFPNSPTLNQVYTDSTSGFSYQWNGTVWISFSAASTVVTIPDGTVTDGSLRISTKAVVGSATTFTEDLVVVGGARITGILTVGTSSLTLNGNTNTINGVSISSGIITATAFVGDGSGLTGAGIGSAGNVNTSGIITASAVSANEFIGTGDKLIFSPTITSFSPTDGATGVSALSSPNIILTYSQPIGFGTTGAITLRTVSAAGTITESFSVGVSTRATISNQTLTIDPTSNLDYNQDYYVVVPSGTITNYVGGIASSLSNYNFTTEAEPTLSSVSPGIGSTNVDTDTNIVFTFNKTIRAGVGTITLRTVSAGGTIVESYDVSSSNRLTFSTSTLTIDPTSNLGVGVTHFVVVPNNAVAGYTGISTYSFTSIFQAFSSINPANGATIVGIDTNITLTFAVTPVRGTGTITLRSGSTSGSVIETFNVSTSSSITVSGNNFIINPTSDLGFSTSIHTIIPSTAIQNYVGLNTTGADTHSFTTDGPPLGSSFGGGFLICKASPLRWVVSPYSAEVSRNWNGRGDANTTAQAVSGCTGWFVPSNSAQLQNPGYLCRSFWGPSPCYSLAPYWSDQGHGTPSACFVNFSTGTGSFNSRHNTYCVRAFRCVTY